MSLDSTLRSGAGLTGARSVLSRAERIARMVDEGKFDPTKDCPLGLPKTKVRHSKAGSKAKKAAAEEAAAEGAPAAEGAAAPAAAGAKPAAGKPAAGAAAAAKPAAAAKGEKAKK
jgi:small basic protein (TIGR04137 family)